MKNLKIIVSGGGTAGHIYPALAVAEKLRERGHQVLFVGALGKMEMEKVPAAGFEIVGLPVAGLKRKFTLSNVGVLFKMMRSVMMANQIIKRFKPNVVVGFGGYASAPIVMAAQRKGIKTIIQEQNSYAGKANRVLAKKAYAICCAYEGMDRFFDAEKIVVTGNPLRIVPKVDTSLKEQALEHFGLARGKKVVLVTGGSLGTRTINEAIMAELQRGPLNDVQAIWQTGKIYHQEMKQRLESLDREITSIKQVDFIDRMDYAYAISDMVICRAGASTISELQLMGKPAIFVPSPNVAEDHQTKNAMAMVDVGAAVMVKDDEAGEKLFRVAEELIYDDQKLAQLSQNIETMAKPNATMDVVKIIEGIENVEKNIFFIGVGGIGMSALARFFKHVGYNVAGYDITKTKLTQELQNEGVDVMYDDDIQLVGADFKDKNTTKVIYTPAIPKTNSILKFFQLKEFNLFKRSQALGILCNDKFLMAVAGTHGKTTTSSMATHFMRVTMGEGSAFLGGIAKNFNSNVVMGLGDKMVVEADEFDRSFLQLTPNNAVVTSADPDHLDIYGTAEEFKHGFEQFIERVKPNGRVIVKKGVDLNVKREDVALYSYSLNDCSADYHAVHLNCNKAGQYEFDLVTPSRTIEGCRLGVPGLINVENCIAAVALIDDIVFDKAKFRTAIASYCGVARRFDMWVNCPDGIYMDDYAHHPDEIKAMINSVRDMFPNRHLTVVFQPHLYTRTRDFADQFASSLSLADKVVLMPIYPARELPIDGVTSKIILDKITCDKEIVEKEKLNERISQMDFDILVTAGAGNIDQHCAEIAQIVKNRVEATN